MRCPFSPIHVHMVIYLYKHRLEAIYFILWIVVQIIIILLFELFFLSEHYFLVHKMLHSACIFPTLALEPITSPRSPGSFYWRIVFRNQDLSGKCAHCHWGILASRFSQGSDLGNIYNPCIYTFFYIYLSTYLSFFNFSSYRCYWFQFHCCKLNKSFPLYL